MRPSFNGEDVSEADLNDSVNIVCLRQQSVIQRFGRAYFRKQTFNYRIGSQKRTVNFLRNRISRY